MYKNSLFVLNNLKNHIRAGKATLDDQGEIILNSGAETISKYKQLNSALKLQSPKNNKIEQQLNTFSMLELISIANDDILIFTDEIKPETNGHPLVIKYLLSWLVAYSHRKIKILLKQEPRDMSIIQDYFLKKLRLKEFDVEDRVMIGVLKHENPKSIKFKCTIIDDISFKLQYEDGSILLAFNDYQDFAKKMSGIFDKYFVKSEPIYDERSKPNKLIDNLKSFSFMNFTNNKSPKDLSFIDSEVRDFFAVETVNGDLKKINAEQSGKSLNNDKIIFQDNVNINMVQAVLP